MPLTPVVFCARQRRDHGRAVDTQRGQTSEVCLDAGPAGGIESRRMVSANRASSSQASRKIVC